MSSTPFFGLFFGILLIFFTVIIISTVKNLSNGQYSLFQSLRGFIIGSIFIVIIGGGGLFIRSKIVGEERESYEASLVRWGAIKPDGTWAVKPNYTRELADFSSVKTTYTEVYNETKKDYDSLALDSVGNKIPLQRVYSPYLTAAIREKVRARAEKFYAKVASNMMGIHIEDYAQYGFVRCWYRARSGGYSNAYKITYHFYVDTAGVRVIDPKDKAIDEGWRSADDFCNGYALVEEKIFIDTKGDFAASYDKAKSFANGLAPVFTYKNDWQIVDSTFKLKKQLPKNYGDVSMFSEGKAAFLLGEKPFLGGDDTTRCGFIDAQGNEIIPATFANVRPFSQGLAAVQDYQTKLWGFIDSEGKWILKPQWTKANSFHNGYAAVATSLPDSRADWKKWLDIY